MTDTVFKNDRFFKQMVRNTYKGVFAKQASFLTVHSVIEVANFKEISDQLF